MGPSAVHTLTHEKLKPGKYYYKFIVDGVWRCNPDFPETVDENGNLNNYIDTQEVENESNIGELGIELKCEGGLKRPP